VIPNKTRIAVAVLAFSASGLVGLTAYESYTGRAVIPVPGDKPTIGFGTTEGVKLGDRTTPPKALARALSDIGKYEGAIKRCVTVPLTQSEYDAYTSLAYNIGPTLFCNSTLVKELNAGHYDAACAHIEDFICGPATGANQAEYGEPCYSTRKPKRVIRGLQNRRAQERAICEGRAP